AQIACRADHHIRVEKAERDGMTATAVTMLEGEEKVRELARMLGGDPESPRSLEHARELLGATARGDCAGQPPRVVARRLGSWRRIFPRRGRRPSIPIVG